jgi:hypothetical protein
MKASYWFPHDFNARGDEKIIRLLRVHGLSGYGLYWALVEKIFEAGGPIDADYESIAFDLHCKHTQVKSVATEFNLFYGSPKKIGSHSADRRIQTRKSLRDSAVKAGKASASARAQNQRPLNDRSTPVQQDRQIDRHLGVPPSPKSPTEARR